MTLFSVLLLMQICSDRTDGKSVSGYVLLLGDAPIVWASRLEGAVTTSTVEAEYILPFVLQLKTSCGSGICLQTWGAPSMILHLLLRITVPALSGPMTLWFPKEPAFPCLSSPC